MPRFDGGAWNHAAVVIQSEGYHAWLAWMVTHIPQEWLNGLASEVTHQRTTDRADMARHD